MRKLALLAAATFAATATPAFADISWSTDQSLGQGQTVQLQNNQTVTPGNTLVGFTNQTNTEVDFTSTQTISTQAAGQALIFGTNTLLNNLTFALADPLLAMTYLEFNLHYQGGGPNGGTADSVTLEGLDGFGATWSDTFDLGNGENFFSALATNGQVITQVTFNTHNGGVTDFRQLRLELSDLQGNPVPEPATWAMMIIGFGAAGIAMRRGRRRKALLAQIA